MPKDTVYYELLEACTDGQCPICLLTSSHVAQMMKGFLYSSVTDPSRREKIKRQHGFCGFHSRQLLELGDPLAHAILYSDLLNQAIKELDSGRKGALKVYEGQEHCLFCETAEDCERLYLPAFLEGFAHTEFAESYQAGGMLCLPHLAKIAALAGRQHGRQAVFERLKDATAAHYQRLNHDLLEIQRKHDYRFQGEAWTDSEREAWKKVVSLFNDQTGLRR